MTNSSFVFRFFTFILLVLIFFVPVKAQSVYKLRSTFSSSGPTKDVVAKGQKYSVQQSIGQSSVIDSYKANGYMLRQGFIQPTVGISTSTKSQNLAASIFPNPFSSNVLVSFSEVIDDNLVVSLYNMFGQIVYCNKYEASQNLNLDLSSFTQGIYIMKINTSRKLLTAKLIKN